MPKANIKSASFILLALTLIIFAGCTRPEERRTQSLDEAAELLASGNGEQALAILEPLNEEFPNDPEILSLIGNIYSDQGDATMAAFFLEQAYRLRPDDVELLYKTYTLQEAAGQNEAAADLLETLAKVDSDAMSEELWLKLGGYRASGGKTQPALDAYLKGVDPEKSTPDPEVATTIGNLFIQLDNLPQAERWFRIAAKSDDPSTLPALFGLLEIDLRKQNWAEAEGIVAQLDKQFPGAVEASQWANVPSELKRWRAAQEAMRAELDKAKAAKEAAQKAQAEAEAAAAETAATDEAVENVEETTIATATEGGSGKAQIIADLEAAEAMADAPAIAAESEALDIKAEGGSGKAQIIADLEAAEAMADAPAIATESEALDIKIGPEALAEEIAEAPTTKAITFDPSITIQPAEPDLTLSVDFDQAAQGATVDYSVNNTTGDSPVLDANGTLAEPLPSFSDKQAERASIRRSVPPRTLDELLADAEQATVDRNYDLAISTYWQALGRANNRADIWSSLSRTYLINGQVKNAETTALEATRLAPDEINYTLDYLRVAQRSKSPADFLAELETAYDRFPRSPEIALSLARAYERINQNYNAARTLYRRFIELAPYHPLRPEAESALARLR